MVKSMNYIKVMTIKTRKEMNYDCYLQCVADCAEFEIPTMMVHLQTKTIHIMFWELIESKKTLKKPHIDHLLMAQLIGLP
jgi:hypothetical protein